MPIARRLASWSIAAATCSRTDRLAAPSERAVVAIAAARLVEDRSAGVDGDRRAVAVVPFAGWGGYAEGRLSIIGGSLPLAPPHSRKF